MGDNAPFCFSVYRCSCSVHAAMDSAPPFCQHQGYTLNPFSDHATSMFDDGKSCDLREFYQGTCGKEYRRDFQCVPLGEPVFEFDHCCEGAPYLRQVILDKQPVRHSQTASRRILPILFIGHMPFFFLLFLQLLMESIN